MTPDMEKRIKMCKVSVIVPVYNVEEYLPKCIETLTGQTLKDIEIILVDDGSKDNSGKICDQYAEKDTRIRVIHKQNAGVSAARNDGIAIAKGEYVIFVDSDDYVPLDSYEKMYENAKANHSDVVLADMYIHKGDKTEHVHFFDKPFVSSDRKYLNELVKTDLYMTYCPNPPAGGPAFGYGGPTNKLVRKQFLEENDIKFDIRVKGIFDDIIYSAYLFATAKTVSYIDVPVYDYRIIGSSLTQSYKSNMLEINDAIFTCWNEFFNKYDPNGEFEKAYYGNVLRRLAQSLGKYFFSPNNPEKDRRKVCKQLHELLSTEPYATAAREVEFKKLTMQYKVLAVLARHKAANAIWFVFDGAKHILGK